MTYEELVNIINSVKPDIGEFELKTPLYQLGLTSLEMMIIICKIERQFNKNITIEDIKGISTVEDLFKSL